MLKMKRILVFGIILLVLFSLGAFAKVDRDSDDFSEKEDDKGKTKISLNESEVETDEDDENETDEDDEDSDDFPGKGKGLKIIKEKGKNKIILNESEIETDEDVEVENDTLFVNKTGKGKLRIKIMPDTASQVAIERLKLLGFTIEFKDVGKRGNDSEFVYDIEGEKEVKVLGFLKTRMKVKARINAENGEMEVKRPWWSFLVPGLDKKEEKEVCGVDSDCLNIKCQGIGAKCINDKCVYPRC